MLELDEIDGILINLMISYNIELKIIMNDLMVLFLEVIL